MEHKFFDRHLDNDLVDLAAYLQTQYDKISSGDIISGELNLTDFSDSGSITTMNWEKYNVFQFYHPGIHNLFKNVKDMVEEACWHYGIDYEEQQFMVQGWFNINYAKAGKLNWHDHGGIKAPYFHGYYCVNAEPTVTHYRVFGKEVINENKNNRAILSEMGHEHAMGDWEWDGPRITIAYDVLPLKAVVLNDPQHWIPLV